MARYDPEQRALMAECQRGIVDEMTSWRSGPFCRKHDLCRAEGGCYFVLTAERHLERAWRTAPPGIIRWIPGFDDDEQAA